MSDENLRSAENLVAGLMEAWNSHDAERVTRFYTSDYKGEDVAQATPQRGPEGMREMMARYWNAFPDLHFTTQEVVVQGNRVALVWTARGTHRGRLMNIPPTGRRIQVQGASLLTVESGRIKRAFYIWDVAGLLREIGLLPEL